MQGTGVMGYGPSITEMSTNDQNFSEIIQGRVALNIFPRLLERM